MTILEQMRDRFHPLHHARGIPGVGWALRAGDVERWARLDGIAWPVRIRAVRHCAYTVLRRSPEPGPTAFVRAAVEVLEPRTFWDVGANFGYFGFVAKSADDRLRVSFVEPDEQNASLIEATIARSGRDGYTVHRCAVSDIEGVASFTPDTATGATGTLESRSSFTRRRWEGAGKVEVTTATLDRLVGGETVDLLKLDVEGHEERALAGAVGVLERSRPALLFECFHGGTEIAAALHELGYTIHDADTASAPSSGTTNFVAIAQASRTRVSELERRWRSLL